VKLSDVIKFAIDMNRAVKFYRDVLGLSLKFQSPGWSEFVTGETTLALHPASEKNLAAAVELGLTVADIQKFRGPRSAKGVKFQYATDKTRLRWFTRTVRGLGRLGIVVLEV
jgi:lactoylglutathione lyase